MAQHKLIFLIVFAFVISACSKNTIPDPDPTEAIHNQQGATSDGFGDVDGVGGEEFGDNLGAGELANIIFFDFDSAEVRAEDTEIVSRHALQLVDNPNAQVRLEGHTDERGSREYNIGLGERRAQSVRRLLLIQGASAAQISTVSFGEERPAVEGSDESAYEQNRRVEIRYTN
ncbi:MAG TPA: peptidoglycan-associated lipoprotein Pal [Woeseiaceae bacterium]|nr:peptidoglycan-associated lipoprotein Pal [Woeseiaceae bacterium]